MSAALASGAAALFLRDHRNATPAQVRDALEANATPGIVQQAGSGSANRLLFVGARLSIDVGVIPDLGATCPGETIQFQMDDEDRNNSNSRAGWNGRIWSGSNTLYTVCRVSGVDFHPVVSNGGDQSYAVLKLGEVCPAGAVEVQRHFDNEDRQNANWVSGSIFPNQIDTNSNLFLCVFRPLPSGPAFVFPDLGFSYGVVAPPTFSPALATGWIYQDDEDRNNQDWYIDGTQSPPLFLIPSPIPSLIQGEDNTTTFLARVR
jgi:hypothetical protein